MNDRKPAKKQRPVTPNTYFVYSDTAGSQAPGSKDVMVTAAVILQKRKAERLDREWLEIFTEYGVTSLHMEQFVAGRGQFKSWKDDRARRDAFLVSLAKSAKRNVNNVILTVLEKSAFDVVDRKFQLRERFQGQYGAAIIFTLAIAVQWAWEKSPNEGIVIWIEHGDVGQAAFLHSAEELLGFRPHVMKKRNPDTGEANTAIQLADFFAYEFRVAYERHVKGNDPRPSRIGLEYLHKVPMRRYVMNEPKLVQLCESMLIPRRPEAQS